MSGKRKTISIAKIDGYICKDEYDVPGFECKWFDGVYVYKKIKEEKE